MSRLTSQYVFFVVRPLNRLTSHYVGCCPVDRLTSTTIYVRRQTKKAYWGLKRKRVWHGCGLKRRRGVYANLGGVFIELDAMYAVSRPVSSRPLSCSGPRAMGPN